MDRVIVYPGVIPLDSDLLNTNRNTMDALGALAAACIGVTGSNLVVDGLALTASGTPDMRVTVGAGSIFSLQTRDGTAYGSLGSDTTNTIVKCGVNVAPTVFTLTAPSTSGYSQNYLIEATFAETDGGATVLPYYNASNPSSPYSGPGGAGTSNNTVRTQRVSLQLKAGSAATAGTQTTPAVDSGWVGLYVLTINNGQTSINQAACDAASVGNLPNVPVKLSQLRRRLTANVVIYVTTTGNDANDGLTVNTPLQTLQAAWNKLANSIDLNGYSATIAVGPGNYSVGILALGAPVGVSSGITIQGYTSNAFTTAVTAPTVSGVSNPTIATTSNPALAFYAGQGWAVTVKGLAMTTSTGTISTVVAQAGAQVVLINSTLGASSFACAYAQTGGQVTFGSGNTFSGSASYAMYAAQGGYILASGQTITISGTPAYSGAFAGANGGTLTSISTTYSGSATGNRAVPTKNGVIDTGTGTAIGSSTYFPGNAFGSATYGGQYA